MPSKSDASEETEQFSHRVGWPHVQKFDRVFSEIQKTSKTKLYKVAVVQKLIEAFERNPAIIDHNPTAIEGPTALEAPIPEPESSVDDSRLLVSQEASALGLVSIEQVASHTLGIPFTLMAEVATLYLFLPETFMVFENDEFEAMLHTRLDDPNKKTALFINHHPSSIADVIRLHGDTSVSSATRFITRISQYSKTGSIIVASAHSGHPSRFPLIICDNLAAQGINAAVRGLWVLDSILGAMVRSEFEHFFNKRGAVCLLSHLAQGASWPRPWRDAAQSPVTFDTILEP